MNRDRLVPLIVAVALFMENMDSTVIATSLPAIAADIGANPLALKLAITSYLLSLAVFIPVSGWIADRFGARTVFRAAIARVRARLDRLRASGSLTIRGRAHRAGHGRRDDDAGRAPGAGAHHRPPRTGRRDGLADHAGADRADHRPAGRRLHHHLFHWHWIFIINVPIGLIGIVLATRYIADVQRRGLERFDHRHGARGRGGRRAGVRASVGGLVVPWPVWSRSWRSARSAGALRAYARRTPAPVLDFALLRMPTFRASVVGGFVFRMGVGAMPFLLPLMLQLGFG